MIAYLLIPLGIVVIVKAEKVCQFTGEIPFAEKIFGVGGTTNFIKVMGLLITIFSFMWIMGGLDWFVEGTIGKFVPGSRGIIEK